MLINNKNLKATFGTNYACYYIYYMLNYSTQKNTNTVTNEFNNTPVRPQYRIVLNAFQKAELEAVNAYREAVGSEPLTIDSELSAYAMYRAYLNSYEGWVAHDWTIQNDSQLRQDMSNIYAGDVRYLCCSENNIEGHSRYTARTASNADLYADSPSHYNAMVNTKFMYYGISCNFWNKETGDQNQFDLFTNDNIDSAMHPHA